VYGAEVLRELNGIIREPVLVISDEPYRPLMFDGAAPPETLSIVERGVLAWSWSKAMAVAGERIGYLAIPPHLAEAAALVNACTFANRILATSTRRRSGNGSWRKSPTRPWTWARTRPSAICYATR